jgi:hypothetical protein
MVFAKTGAASLSGRTQRPSRAQLPDKHEAGLSANGDKLPRSDFDRIFCAVLAVAVTIAFAIAL